MAYPSMLSFSSSSEEPDWAGLPENVIFLIVSQLFLLSDMFNFGSVCTRWYSVFQYRLQTLSIHRPSMFFRKRLPMLLIPTFDSSTSTRNLYSVPCAGIYDLKLSVPYNNRCVGSSHGWLIFLDSLSFEVTLFNPFYFGNGKGTIKLPPFQEAAQISGVMEASDGEFFSDNFINKAILSADPYSCTDFIMMVIHSERKSLAFYKSGDATWKHMYDDQSVIFDIIHYHGYFLAVNFWGEVHVCDVNSSTPRYRLWTMPLLGPLAASIRRYMAESDEGTLLQVVRLVSSQHTGSGEASVCTTGFKVYKLVDLFDVLVWIPIQSIDDGALFLGENYTTHVKASDYPGIKCDSIYFTDDYHTINAKYDKPCQYGGYQDSGIYLMKDRQILNHYVPCPEQKILPPPIWILPTI